MKHIIVFQNPWNKRIDCIRNGDSEEMQVYSDLEAAERDVPNIPILHAARYQIIPLDELE